MKYCLCMKNKNLQSLKGSRVVWLDVARLFAMFMVVCCHCADPFNFYPGGNPPAEIPLWGALWGSFLRPCVPLFVMITGALMLPVREEASLFYKKRITRVFFPFVIWSVIYALFPYLTGVIGLDSSILLDFFAYGGDEVTRQSLGAFVEYASYIPFNFPLTAVHMWYIYLLIGLYLYLPIFSAWVERASEKAKLWFIVAWGIASLLPYYNEFANQYLWGTCSWNAYGMLYYFAGFNGYLLLGHYLRNHNWNNMQLFCYGIPMFVVGYLVTYYGFITMRDLPNPTPEQYELFWTYNSLNVIAMTIPCFMLAKSINVQSFRLQMLLANLTKCGFGVYMVHFFFTGPAVILARALDIPIPLQIPFAAIVAFAASWLIVALLYSAIGKRARWLVG